MPTIKYSNNPNEETAFVTTEDDTRTRVVLTTPVDGTVKFPDNPNSTKVSVTVDGVARKAVAVYNLGGGGGGGGDQHNLGWYATETALTTAHPTATAGDFAIVGSTDTVWVWDTDNEEWVDSDQKGQVTSVNGQTGAVTVDTLPDQTGQSGKFLTTDGTDASWSDITKVNTTITLTAAGWSSNTQTVTVNGITATSVVWVSPDPSDQADYVAGGILCTAQAANSLTFTASTTPTNDIDVVVVAM